MKIRASEKIKRRYLMIEAGSRKEIENAILDYIGILGWARASPVFVDIKASDKNTKNEGGRIVLSVDREEVENVRAAFEAAKVKIKILRVSGTIKGLK
jgi:RNase P/RNase MRP subunit POP5